MADEKAAITADLANLPTRTKPLSYYYELDPTFYSVTSKTFIGSVLAMAQLTNIADPSDVSGKAFGYPQLSAETIIKANPDMVLLADTVCCQQSLATVAKRPGWSTLTAVKNGHVLALNDDIASQWGTRVPALLQSVLAEAAKIPASDANGHPANAHRATAHQAIAHQATGRPEQHRASAPARCAGSSPASSR